MMKQILLDEETVRAILDGRQTQVRPIMNPQPYESSACGEWCWVWRPKKAEKWFNWGEGFDIRIGNISPYSSFDNENFLWVREKHTIECPYGPAKGCDNPDHVIYWAAEEPIVRDSITAKWRPSRHMPRWASRLTLRVLEVRTERVQDITLQDCIAEGMNWWDQNKARASFTGAAYQRYWWKTLWDSINASRRFGWDANPWVWVVEFEKFGGFER